MKKLFFPIAIIIFALASCTIERECVCTVTTTYHDGKINTGDTDVMTVRSKCKDMEVINDSTNLYAKREIHNCREL